MKIIGLTGSSGSGKTSAAGIFIKNGFYHLDCDRLVHDSVYRDPEVLSALSNSFGPQVISNDGAVNRKVLADIVFSDDQKYKLLTSTVNPFILKAIENNIQQSGANYLLLDAPQLFESGLDGRCDFTVAVVADYETSIRRICKRDGITPDMAKARLAKQKPESFYTGACDFVIYNNNDLESLESETLKVIRLIKEAECD